LRECGVIGFQTIRVFLSHFLRQLHLRGSDLEELGDVVDGSAFFNSRYRIRY
jgi:hypothetical protein